jgi:hypothetical protein
LDVFVSMVKASSGGYNICLMPTVHTPAKAPSSMWLRPPSLTDGAQNSVNLDAGTMLRFLLSVLWKLLLSICTEGINGVLLCSLEWVGVLWEVSDFRLSGY